MDVILAPPAAALGGREEKRANGQARKKENQTNGTKVKCRAPWVRSKLRPRWKRDGCLLLLQLVQRKTGVVHNATMRYNVFRAKKNPQPNPFPDGLTGPAADVISVLPERKETHHVPMA